MITAACPCSPGKKLCTVKHSAGWIIPGILLAILPKCPLCLAAWLSLVPGIGISAYMAGFLHSSLITLCLLFCGICLIQHIRLLRHSRIH